MRIIAQSIADNVDIARALMSKRIPFTFVPIVASSRVNAYIEVSEDFAHITQRAIDEVLAKSRYYFAP